MATTELTLSVVVDSTGDYAVGKTDEEARNAFESDIIALCDTEGFRLFRVTLNVPLPEPVELTGEVAESGEAATLAVK